MKNFQCSGLDSETILYFLLEISVTVVRINQIIISTQNIFASAFTSTERVNGTTTTNGQLYIRILSPRPVHSLWRVHTSSLRTCSTYNIRSDVVKLPLKLQRMIELKYCRFMENNWVWFSNKRFTGLVVNEFKLSFKRIKYF